MKKILLVFLLALLLTLAVTLTASATEKIYFGGFFYEKPGWDFCMASGDKETYTPDGFLDGCGFYITDNSGLGQTAIWIGTIDGKSGTCVFHLRIPKDMATDKSHGVANQCTGDLAGYHSVAEGEFVNFTWEGWYHWDPKD